MFCLNPNKDQVKRGHTFLETCFHKSFSVGKDGRRHEKTYQTTITTPNWLEKETHRGCVRAFQLTLTLGSGEGTGRQRFSCTLDDRRLDDVEINVVIVAL